MLTVKDICHITGVEWTEDQQLLKKRFYDLGQDARDKEDYSRWLLERTPLWLACNHLNIRTPEELIKRFKTIQQAAEKASQHDQASVG